MGRHRLFLPFPLHPDPKARCKKRIILFMTFLVTITKNLSRSNLREKDIILVHSFKDTNPVCWGDQGRQSAGQLVRLHRQSAIRDDRKWGKAIKTVRLTPAPNISSIQAPLVAFPPSSKTAELAGDQVFKHMRL